MTGIRGKQLRLLKNGLKNIEETATDRLDDAGLPRHMQGGADLDPLEEFWADEWDYGYDPFHSIGDR